MPAPSTRPPAANSLAPLIVSGLAVAICLAIVLFYRFSPRAVPPARLPELARTNLVRLDGRWCRTGETNPFTGILLDYYPHGGLQSRSIVSNGLLSGLSEGWYTNGQLQVRENYQTNYSNGLRTKWYPDGKKLSEAVIVAGKMEETFRRWYENGKLAEEIPMRHGKIEGVGRSFYESGCLKTELTIHDGRTLNAKSWPDGQQPGPGP